MLIVTRIKKLHASSKRGEITVIAIYAVARKYTVLCSLSDVASAESPHQAAFTSFTDSNFRPTKERFTDAFNLFLGEAAFPIFPALLSCTVDCLIRVRFYALVLTMT